MFLRVPNPPMILVAAAGVLARVVGLAGAGVGGLVADGVLILLGLAGRAGRRLGGLHAGLYFPAGWLSLYCALR